jgi:hypothetical protein
MWCVLPLFGVVCCLLMYSVMRVVGSAVFAMSQNFILPCMEQALHDTEEFVIARSLQAMGALSHLGLFDTEAMVLVGTRVVPLLCHPR